MKAFLSAVLAAALLGVVAWALLERAQAPVDIAFATKGVRL